MDETTPPRDAPEQTTLPFDAALDEPIPFALTARARRAIAPETLPQLTVLDQPALEDAAAAEPDDPHDTRPARARALRHAGVDVDQIADELGVDPLVARAWVADVTPVRSARRRLRAVPGGRPGTADAGQEARRRRAEEAFRATRDAARLAVRDRVAADAGFAAGLGLVTALAEVSPHGIVLTIRDLATGRAALRWLTGTVEIEPGRLRLLLRLAPQVAADVAVHTWHRATGVGVDRITSARWRDAPTAEAVEAMVRVADPRVAGALAGWRDALLERFEHDGEVERAW